MSGLQGSGGIPLIRKLCYAVGGVPNQVTTAAMAVSLQIFLLDVVQVEVVLQTKILPVPTVTIHSSDGGLLRVLGLVREPGLGRRDGPSDRVPGGPQSLDQRGKTQPLVGRLVAERHDAPPSSKSPNPLRPVRPLSRRLSRRLVLSTPFAVLSYLLLWFVPPGPAAGGVLWFLVTTCLFETLMSVNQ